MVSDQLLLVFKLLLLALLYLFFFRVVRAVWQEVRAMPATTTGATPLGRRKAQRNEAEISAPHFAVLEPIELAGRIYPLLEETSIGRAAGCQITLDDTYSSQIHARVFFRDGNWQIEDMGSTNGTWLNRHKVTAPTVLKAGDVVQIGNTVMELQ